MAAGDTLFTLTPQGAVAPSSNWAQLVQRNGQWVLAFDQTTQEAMTWPIFIPRLYSSTGITVYVTWVSVPTSGTAGFDVAFERIGDGSQDIDSDGFASAQTITAVTVPGTSGNSDITNVAVSDGANIDSLVGGEWGRLRLRRDVANDNAAGDIQVLGVEGKQT